MRQPAEQGRIQKAKYTADAVTLKIGRDLYRRCDQIAPKIFLDVGASRKAVVVYALGTGTSFTGDALVKQAIERV